LATGHFRRCCLHCRQWREQAGRIGNNQADDGAQQPEFTASMDWRLIRLGRFRDQDRSLVFHGLE